MRVRIAKKNGSLTMLEEMDAEIGASFPIQIVVFVSSNVSSRTQIFSNLIINNFLKSFLFTRLVNPKESSLSKNVSRI